MAKDQATVTSVPSSAASVMLVDAEGSREGLLIFNDSTQILYVKLGTTASLADYSFQIAPKGYWEADQEAVYAGRIDGIWAAANGAAKITSISG